MNAGDYIASMQARVPMRVASTYDWYRRLNAAGEAFYLAHSWSFAAEQTATIEAVAGRDYLVLPDDYVTLSDAAGDNLGRYAIRRATTGEIIKDRQDLSTSGPGWTWKVAFDAPSEQVTGADYPELRAPIYPTPTTDGSPTFVIAYRRGWRDIPANASSARPNIPRHARAVFDLCCRVAAWENLLTTPSPDRPAYAEALAALIAADQQASGAVDIEPGVCRKRPHDYALGTWEGD